jgi:hypothetical protein
MPTRIFESSTSSNELSFAIFPAETRSCLELTSALHDSMIVVEEWICWKIFQCKRVMREKYLFSQLRCCHSLRVTKAGSRQLRSSIFPEKRQTVFKRSSLLYAIHYNVLMNEFWILGSYNGYFASHSEI